MSPQRNRTSLGGLWLGIAAAVVVFWSPVAGVLLAAAGVVLAALGYREHRRSSRGLAVAGLVITAAVLFFCVTIAIGVL